MATKFTEEQERKIAGYLIEIGEKINNLINEVDNLRTRLNAQESRIKMKDAYVQ